MAGEETILTGNTDTGSGEGEGATGGEGGQQQQNTEPNGGQQQQNQGSEGEGGDAGGQAGAGEGGEGEISIELKLDDGSVLNENDVKQLTELAKGKKWDQETANEVMSLVDARVQQTLEALQVQANDQVDKWREAAEADPEIGGENFQANSQLAARAVQKFATPEFIDILRETGYGNHPELIKVFVNIGKAMGEDTFESGNRGGGNIDMASVLYPNQGNSGS